MAVTPYCSMQDVASLAKMWTTDGIFTENTNPMASEVESWIEQVSAMVDLALAQEGFAVPMTNTSALASIKPTVSAIVSDLCHAANSSGRFFTQAALERGTSPMFVIRREINDWVSLMASGFEQLGASRQAALQDTIGYSEYDSSGTKVEPMFTRGDKKTIIDL